VLGSPRLRPRVPRGRDLVDETSWTRPRGRAQAAPTDRKCLLALEIHTTHLWAYFFLGRKQTFTTTVPSHTRLRFSM